MFIIEVAAKTINILIVLWFLLIVVFGGYSRISVLNIRYRSSGSIYRFIKKLYKDLRDKLWN